MEKSFPYIIRQAAATKTNDVTMRLSGLPANSSKFYCEVVTFFVDAVAADFNNYFIELRADGMGLLNGKDSIGGFSTIAFTNTNNTNTQSPYSFLCENFNGRSIQMRLYDEANTLLLNKTGATNYAKEWILVLKITPLD